MRLEEYGPPSVFSPWTGGDHHTTYGDDIVPGPSSQPMERARHLSSEMDLVGAGAAQKEKEDVDMGEEKDEHREQGRGRIESQSKGKKRVMTQSKGKKRVMSKDPSDKGDEKDEGERSNSA